MYFNKDYVAKFIFNAVFRKYHSFSKIRFSSFTLRLLCLYLCLLTFSFPFPFLLFHNCLFSSSSSFSTSNLLPLLLISPSTFLFLVHHPSLLFFVLLTLNPFIFSSLFFLFSSSVLSLSSRLRSLPKDRLHG